jgi:hypothetical protein
MLKFYALRSSLAFSLALLLAACGSGSDPAPATPKEVADSPSFTVGGSVKHLPAGSTLTLKNSNGDVITVAADGTFTFPSGLAPNASYAITVDQQPVGLTCSVANNTGSGVGVQANVNNISIVCSPNTYTIGGTVAGLAAGDIVTLKNNGDDTLQVSANGNFTFATPVAYNGSYNVTVVSPVGKTCSLANNTGSGSEVQVNVSSVAITCSTATYTIGGSVTGLRSGDSITLQNNSGDAKTITADGTFTFTTPVAYNGSYIVTTTSPTGLSCSVTKASGQSISSNVTDVAVACDPIIVSYTTAGSYSYTVPSGVTSLQIVATGGGGGGGAGGTGGHGAIVTTTITVSPGESLNLVVGGGGGQYRGGGGSSNVSWGNSPLKWIIAGGGGGSGGYAGRGGDAGGPNGKGGDGSSTSVGGGGSGGGDGIGGKSGANFSPSQAYHTDGGNGFGGSGGSFRGVQPAFGVGSASGGNNDGSYGGGGGGGYGGGGGAREGGGGAGGSTAPAGSSTTYQVGTNGGSDTYNAAGGNGSIIITPNPAP